MISGDADAVEQVAEGFAALGRRVRRLRVSHAFHSHLMDPVLGELGRVAAGLEHRAPRLPWAGALSGELVSEPEAGYWTAQARQPVRYADAVATLASQGITMFRGGWPGRNTVRAGPGCRARPDRARWRRHRGGVHPAAAE